MMRSTWTGWGLLLVALLAVAGCGGDGMSEVSGTVKVNGTPVENGAISFIPVDGKSQTTGGMIKGGHYSVRVPAGAMKVAINAPQSKGKVKLYLDDPKSPERDVFLEALPPRYSDIQQTELRLEINGTTQKDWDLPSK
jgi:hypothetical protein